MKRSDCVTQSLPLALKTEKARPWSFSHAPERLCM